MSQDYSIDNLYCIPSILKHHIYKCSRKGFVATVHHINSTVRPFHATKQGSMQSANQVLFTLK